jgi:hypothetical protein
MRILQVINKLDILVKIRNANNMRALIAIISLLTYSCFGQVNHCITNCRYLTYSYSVDNKDSNHIGFCLIEGDESYGVKSIAIFPNSKYVFIIDASYNNLKRIDISTGKILSSKKMNDYFKDDNHTLIDVAVFKGKIYATSNSDILIFDADLNYLNSIKVKSEVPNTVRFSKVTKDSLFIYLSHKQLQDRDIEEEQLVITDKINFINKIRIPISQFIGDSKKKRALGKEYWVNMADDKVVLYNKYGCYELKGSIPNIKYFSSRNIDFDDKSIVYFDSTPKQFTLYCYLIPSD